MGDVQAGKLGERQIEEPDPGRLRRRGVEPGQHQEFAGAGGGDIPEPDVFAIEFFLFRLARGLIAIGRNAQDRTIEGVAVGDR